MTNTTPTPEPSTMSTTATVPQRRRFGAIAAAGLLAGLVAAGVGGVAAAQTGSTTVIGQDTDDGRVTSVVLAQDELPEDGVIVDDHELTEEEEAVFARFDQCLTDAGLDLEALDAAEDEDGQAIDIDEAVIDAAFESCEPILEELGDEFMYETVELSPEDEALFDQFDQCLTDAGVPMFEAEEIELDDPELGAEEMDDGVAIETFEFDGEEAAAIDAAFESCEPILDGLSDEAMFFVDEGFCEEDHDDE